jgi:hypothetical protein
LLRDLATSTAHARTHSETCARAAAQLSSNARDIPFALIYLAVGDGSKLTLESTCGIGRG